VSLISPCTAGEPRTERRAVRTTAGLGLEFALLFVVPPALLLALRHEGVRVPVIPTILAALVVFAARIAGDRSFRWRDLLATGASRTEWSRVARTFALGALGLCGLTCLVAPDELFRLPSERTELWLAILLSYPLLSVVPQELVFRPFFFHRYRPLFGGERALWLGSALAFGWAHALFGEPLSVLLSGLGGLLFGRTWLRTRSLWLVSFEHALYGCFVFTVGLHGYFRGGP
jgi:membrane protease YdiL (CAAX protease family)